MSRYVLEAKTSNIIERDDAQRPVHHTHSITVGWDEDMGRYYATIFDLIDDEQGLSELEETIVTHDIEELIAATEHYAIIPETLRDQLLEDQFSMPLSSEDALLWENDFSNDFDINEEVGFDITDSGMER